MFLNHNLTSDVSLRNLILGFNGSSSSATANINSSNDSHNSSNSSNSNNSHSNLFLNGDNFSGDQFWHDDPSLMPLRIGFTAFAVFCIFVASLAGNLFVCLVFYKRPSLLTISNRFILNLTCCNILNTMFVMPFVFVTTITQEWVFKGIWCQSTGFLMNLIFAASTLTLVVISIDRYCAVISPLHYNMRITTQRATMMIIGVWLLAIVASLPPLVGWNHFEYQPEKYSCTVLWRSPHYSDRTYTLFLSLICFVTPLMVMLWVYVVIFRAAKDNSERARRNSVIPTNGEEQSQTPLRCSRRRSSTAPIILSRKLSTSSRTSSLLWHRDEWKAAITSMLVVSTFVVCWLPYFVIIVLESSVLLKSEDIHPFLQGAAIFLALSSCAFNPLVYVFRSKVARQELVSILHPRRSHPALTRGNSNGAETGAALPKRGPDTGQKDAPPPNISELCQPQLAQLTETTLSSTETTNNPNSAL
ncbi:G-protein coupled receptor 161-like [Octopus sinensis]|uniref:G-protein coupled receptor 161-like n=1 Tax=Octopus sinensis TaxID=2607531 RepID=A0A6P7TY86_9MOLL|nr:G-protein coupled receptor 161-like [Octopus sinensis]